MLVDCGGIPKTIEKVVGNITDEFLPSHERYLMLSHLHEDHYNGLNKLFEAQIAPKFDEVYLPDYITNGSLELYASMIFFDPDSALGREARYVLQIPGLLQKHLASYAKICFLSEGGKVSNALCDFEVLLPRKRRERLWDAVVTPIKEFCDIYREILGYIENESGNITVRINPQSNINNLVEKLYTRAKIDATKVDKARLEELKKHFKTNRNELSLAFHECGVDDSDNVLFLGDADPLDIEKINLNSSYAFIKVQHHGTRNYFYSKLPHAKYYAISNGGGRDSWEISALYDVHYRGEPTLICTNNCNCELVKKGVSCTSKSNRGDECDKNAPFISIDIP